MGTVIAFSNHKGGVGKTTSAVNVGAALVKLRRKVLLVDLDPQANLTQSLGLSEHVPTVYEALRGEEPLTPVEVFPGLDAITSTLDLSGAEVELSTIAGREFILRELLDPFRKRYDYVLVDSPPSLGLLTVNAFTAADQVYIPLQPHFLALQGLGKLREVVDKVAKRLNKGLKVGGVFLTQYDRRKVLHRQVEEVVRQSFPKEAMRSTIRDNVALAEAPTSAQDVLRYAPHSHGAEDYLALAKELDKRTRTR